MIIRPAWITPEGERLFCPNPNDHMYAAAERFPESHNPERDAELSGWIKVTSCKWEGDCPAVYSVNEPTQKQLDALYDHFGKLFDVALESITYHMGYVSARARA